MDREGREEPLSLPPAGYEWPRVSPDGARVAVAISDEEGWNVWTSDVARGTLSILTPEPGNHRFPLWTTDGQRVVFSSRREGSSGLFWKAADGGDAGEPLLTGEAAPGSQPFDWSPDGNELLVSYDRNGDIGVLSMEGERPWQPLLNSAAGESNPALSPDERWIAYHSDETGQDEVYVEQFPDLGNREQVSTGGGREPVWSPDGRELFYRDPEGSRMMVVPIETEPTLVLRSATVVFDGPYLGDYDLAPDGRFLMIKQGDEASTSGQIIVVQNWLDALAQRVPVP